MVELVQLSREHGYDKLREAVIQALELGLYGCASDPSPRRVIGSSTRAGADSWRCGTRRAHEVMNVPCRVSATTTR